MSRSRRSSAVHGSQMPTDRKVPNPLAAERGVHGHETGHEYALPPFDHYRHDKGPNDMPVKVGENHGEHLPKDHAPGQTSPAGPVRHPSPGTRRFGRAL